MDREAFRERFKAYKEGKPVSEIYDAGLPKYAGGKKGRRYIGGSTKLAREAFWNQDPVVKAAVDSISNAYGLHDGALKYRLDQEGFTDKAIRLINNAKDLSVYYGNNLLNNKTDFSGVNDFGLDDAATMINDGRMLLINENWYDEGGTNEKGRNTNGAVGATLLDTIGLLAAALKYFTDEAKKDNPALSDYDAARYGLAYYNRGSEGGRKWAKSGAKGYNFNTASNVKTEPMIMRLPKQVYPIKTTIQNTAAPKFGKYANGKLPGFRGGLIPQSIPIAPISFFRLIGQKLRDRMYKTVYPHGYTEDQIHNFISGNQREFYGDPNVEALFGKYTNQDSIIADVDLWKHPKDVEWRPLSFKEYPKNNDTQRLGKFAVKDLIRLQKNNPDSYELIYPTATDSYGNYIFRPHSDGKEDWYHNELLGWYLAGTKSDSTGTYNYAKDTWDINPFKGSSSEDGTIFKYGKYIGLDKIGDIVPFGKPFKLDIRQYVNTK